MVITRPVARLPNLAQHLARQVVVAAGIEYRCPRPLRALVEGIPFRRQPGLVLRVALDQVTNVHDQLRPQQVELRDGDLEDFLALAARQVGENGVGELVAGCVRDFVGPRQPITGDIVRKTRTVTRVGRAGTRSLANRQAACD